VLFIFRDKLEANTVSGSVDTSGIFKVKEVVFIVGKKIKHYDFNY
jgi:hypothetical protein